MGEREVQLNRLCQAYHAASEGFKSCKVSAQDLRKARNELLTFIEGENRDEH